MYVGTDLVEVKKINNLILNYNKKFLNRVYSNNEQNYCKNKKAPQIHYAARFAAKEAVKKTLLQSKLISSIKLKNIEINNSKDGAPYIIIKNYSIDKKIQISISHTDKYAIAFAILF